MPVIPGRTACFRCVYPDPPSGAQPTCETAGVLNVIVSLVASVVLLVAFGAALGGFGSFLGVRRFLHA